MRAKLLAVALLLAPCTATPASSDILAVDIMGRITGFTGRESSRPIEGIFDTTAILFNTELGTLTGQSWPTNESWQPLNCNCSGQLLGGQFGQILVTGGFFGLFFPSAESNSTFTWDNGLVSLQLSFPGSSRQINFSQLTGTGDFQTGPCDVAVCGTFSVFAVSTRTFPSFAPVPGPAVGAGLPGLMMLLALWLRWRRT